MANTEPVQEIIQGQSMADYLLIPMDSRSSLVDQLDSPELYFGKHVDGSIDRKVETPGMTLGTMIDAFITEDVLPSEPVLPDNVVIADSSICKTNGARNPTGKLWKAFAEENPGKEIRTPRQMEKEQIEHDANVAICYRVRDQIRAHRGARRVLLSDDRIAQPTIIAKINGLWIKSRPDVVPARFQVCGDLKVSGAINPKFYCNRVSDYGYDIQGWLSVTAWHKVTQEPPRKFVNVVVRAKEPYDVAAYELSPEFMKRGQALAMQAIDDIKRCQDSGQWRTEDFGDIVMVDPPRYMRVSNRDEREAAEQAE